MENLLTDTIAGSPADYTINAENERGIKHTYGPNNCTIVDGLFDSHFISEVEHWFMTEQEWKLDNTANRYSKPYGLEGFHKFLAITHYQMHESFLPEFGGVDPLLAEILKSCVEHLGIQDSLLNSIQSNAMPYGCDGTWHVDVGGTYNKMFDRIVAVDQMYTLMFFCNSTWKPEWAGAFQYIDRNEQIQTIEYVPGRVIMFPAVLKHRAFAPAEKYIYRLSTVFRLLLSIEWVYNNQDPDIHQNKKS